MMDCLRLSWRRSLPGRELTDASEEGTRFDTVFTSPIEERESGSGLTVTLFLAEVMHNC